MLVTILVLTVVQLAVIIVHTYPIVCETYSSWLKFWGLVSCRSDALYPGAFLLDVQVHPKP